MRLKAPANFWHQILPKPLPASVHEVLRYETSSRLVRIPLYVFPDDIIEHIYKECKKHTDARINRLTKKIDDYRMLAQNPTGAGVGKLERLVVAMTAYIRTAPHKFLFVENSDGTALPYYVTNIKYHPREKGRNGNGTEAYVTLTSYGINRGKKDSCNFHWSQNALFGKPKVGQLLAAKNAYIETPAAYDAWLKEVEAYNKIKDGVGIQFLADGFDEAGDALTRDGASTKLVLDDTVDDKTDDEANERGDDDGILSSAFWLTAKTKLKQEAKDDDDDDEEEESDGEKEEEGLPDPDDEDDVQTSLSVAAPVHPYLQFFDLERHEYITCHTNCVRPYEYKKDLASKLVLPDEHRELIEILSQGAAEVMEDIVSGKTGGTVVACTGDPGTGKTLTAEVCAEEIQKPLYRVQCSQLGTDEEEIEKKLARVLKRASRWTALLLIDEADVYVRERGDDIQQNAIVGVFLRLLERYRGVLFLTSNRATAIDDAVMSRCIAHVKYGPQTGRNLHRQWAILADNYKVKLSDKDIESLMQQFPVISGRNIKNLLKLAGMVAKRKKEPVTVKTIKAISAFVEMLKPAKQDEIRLQP
jgi:hypothetical protein